MLYFSNGSTRSVKWSLHRARTELSRTSAGSSPYTALKRSEKFEFLTLPGSMDHGLAKESAHWLVRNPGMPGASDPRSI